MMAEHDLVEMVQIAVEDLGQEDQSGDNFSLVTGAVCFCFFQTLQIKSYFDMVSVGLQMFWRTMTMEKENQTENELGWISLVRTPL